MAVSQKIEVLAANDKVVTVAFYYDIVTPLAGAVDATRDQFGTRLTAADVTGLQDGSIYGERVSRTIEGLTPAEVASRMIAEYTAYETRALQNYVDKYTNAQYVGKAWNGSWS